MKSLKILSFVLALFFVAINSSFAQTQPAEKNLSEEEKAELASAMEEYFTAIDLTDEQKVEFEAITKKYAAEMRTVQESSGGKLQKMKQLKSIRSNKNAEMKKLLSEDQYKIYLEKQDEMQQKMRENRNQG